jgi:hypothetical protein
LFFQTKTKKDLNGICEGTKEENKPPIYPHITTAGTLMCSFTRGHEQIIEMEAETRV